MNSWQEQLNDEVRGLQDQSLDALRSSWAQRYGKPPAIRSPDMLRQMLAWRIQAEAFGGLAPDVRRAVFAKGPLDQLTPGMRLARQWRGQRVASRITCF